MTMLRSLAFVLAIAVAARAIGAQADPDSAHRIGCRLAAQTLLTGNPDPKMNWAIRAIPELRRPWRHRHEHRRNALAAPAFE